jgi:hypothetical protein
VTPLERLARTYATALAAVIGATWAWVAIGDGVVRRTGLTGLFPRLPSTEVRDRFAVAVLVGTTAVAAVAPAVVARARAGRAPGVARPGLTGALGWVGIAVATVATWVGAWAELVDDDVQWAGLGPRVAVGAVLVATAVVVAARRGAVLPASVHRVAPWLAAAVLAVAYLPSMTQFSGGIIDLFGSSTVFNEMLLARAGITASGDFAAQYSSLLGWPIALTRGLGAGATMTTVLAWLWLLTLLQMVALGVVVRRLHPRLAWPLALLGASVLVLMKGSHQGRITGSLAATFFSLPSRSWFACVAGATVAVLVTAGRGRGLAAVALGALMPLAAMNNLEFGVPTAVACALAAGLAHRAGLVGGADLRRAAAAAVATLGVVLGALAIWASPFSLDTWSAMVRAQGAGGYMNVRMPREGTWLVAFGVLAGAGVVGVRLAWARHGSPAVRAAAVVAAYGAAWGLLSAPYYSGRSWPSHIQIFFIPVTICLAALAALVRESGGATAVRGMPRRALAALAPLGLALALPAAALTIAPSPATEWRRALGDGAEWSVESQSASRLVRAVRTALARYDLSPSETVFVGDQYAGTVTLLTGLRNGLATNSLEYSLISAEMRELGCRRLPGLAPRWIVVQNDDGRTNFIGLSSTDSACPGMGVVHAPSDIPVTVFSYARP